MDPQMKDALVKSINIVVEGVHVTQLSQLRDGNELLQLILKKIEPETQLIEGAEENIKYICGLLDRHFGIIIERDEVSLGCELEMGKFGCLLLNMLVTSKNPEVAAETVTKIQLLPNEHQLDVMKMIKVVVENKQSDNLNKMITDALSVNVDGNAQASSPVDAQDGSFLYGSPDDCHGNRPASSPLGKYFESPQYLYKKVLNENSQLRRRIDSKFEEKFEIAEKKIQDLNEKSMRLEKEKEHQLQKNYDLERVIEKLNKDIEFLTNEVGEKNSLISCHVKEIKKLREEINNLQENMQRDIDKVEKLEEKKSLMEEEQKRFKELMKEFDNLQEKYAVMKSQHALVIEEKDQVTLQMEKLKSDHSDYVSNLKEEIARIERQYIQREESQESLAEAMRRETDINNLKIENEKLKQDRKDDEEKNYERIKSHQKQTSQYMDQISALLKQVEEHSLRNETLNEKIQITEKKYKLLEKEIGKCEDSAKEINEQIQQRSDEVKVKDKKIADLLDELERGKSKHLEENLALQKDYEWKLCEQQQHLEEMLVNHTNDVKSLKDKHGIELNEKDSLLASSKEYCSVLKEEIAKLEIGLEKSQVEYSSQIECLQKEVDEHKITIEDYEECKQKRKKELENIKDQNKLLDAQLLALKVSKEEESNSSKQQTSQYMDQISVLLNQVNENSSRNEALNSKVATLEGKCIQFETEAGISKKDFHDQIQMKNEEIKQKDVKICKMSNEMEEMLKKNKEEILTVTSDFEKTVDELNKEHQKEININKKQIEEIMLKQKQAMEEMMDKNEDEINRKNVELETSKRTCLELRDAQTKLKVDYEKKQNKILDEQLTVLKSLKEEETNSLKKQNLQYMDQISVLLNQVNENAVRNEALNSKVMSLEEKCSHIETAKETSIKEFSEKLAEKEKELERYEVSIAETVKEKDSLCQENNLLKGKVHELEKAKEDLEKGQAEFEDRVSCMSAEIAELKTIVGQKDMMIETYSEQNKDISVDLENKDRMIQELEDRVVEEQLNNRQLKDTVRSLEVQSQHANSLIQSLKKKVEELQELKVEEESFHQEIAESRRQTFAVGFNPRRETFAVDKPAIDRKENGLQRNPSFKHKRRPYEPLDTIIQSPANLLNSPDTEKEPLSIADLDDSSDEMQPPLPQPKKDRKSICSLPIMNDDDLDEENPLIRTYSLRDMRSKRKSIQPRRYMASSTPPDRRTSGEEFLQISSFAPTEDEPEVLDNMEWNMIAHLKKDQPDDNLCDDEKSRLFELQRRNTLCLPHLRSAYPMELTVSTEHGDMAETTIREGSENDSRKRKMDMDSAVDFRKVKRPSMASSTKTSRPPFKNGFGNLEDTIDQLPKSGVSFDIAFEPAKAAKPKIARLQASSNLLKKDKPSVSSSTLEVTSKNERQKTFTQKSSTTGNLTKRTRAVEKKTIPTATKNDRRLTQTLSKPSKELRESAQDFRKTDTKPLREIKNNSVTGQRVKKNTAADNMASGDKLTRGDTKRSSFSKAKTRVAASLRGKK